MGTVRFAPVPTLMTVVLVLLEMRFSRMGILEIRHAQFSSGRTIQRGSVKVVMRIALYVQDLTIALLEFRMQSLKMASVVVTMAFIYKKRRSYAIIAT